MNKLFLVLIVSFIFISQVSFALTRSDCKVVEDDYSNSILQANEIYLTSDSTEFNLVTGTSLFINVFGEAEKFISKQISVVGDKTKIDYVSEDNPMTRAVLLIDRTPAKALSWKKFYGLLVIINTKIDLSGGSILKSESLVYNVKCTI